MKPMFGWSVRMAGIFGVILALGLSSYGLLKAGCESPDEALSAARNLSPEELGKLYRRCEALQAGQPGTLYLRKPGKKGTGLPPGFKDLGVDRIEVSARKVEVRLAWCIDSGVALNVYTKGERAPSVVLNWGLPAKAEELWPRKAAAESGATSAPMGAPL